MGMNLIINKLSEKWGVDYDAAEDICKRLDVEKWLGGEPWDSITHAGTIDNYHSDMFYGHNGYWVSDGEYLAFMTNGDPMWTSLGNEDAVLGCGLDWDEKETLLFGYEI